MKRVVAPADEFAPGSRRVVRIGGREIGIFRVGDRYFALRNRCPHQGGPLCMGQVVQPITAEQPGQPVLDDGVPFIVCPWHGWYYDVENGKAYAPGDLHVRSFSVSVEPGRTLFGEDQGGPRFVAETFPVHIEGNYVVIDA